MTTPRPTYDPRQLNIVNEVLTKELEEARAVIIQRLAKEWNIFQGEDTLRSIKKLAEPDIIYGALQDYTNRKFPVITICGSINEDRVSRELWDETADKLSREGWVVLTVHIWEHEELHSTRKGRMLKLELDEMYKQKIRMSNAIYVLNVNGYIGTSTKNEIDYARSVGKQVIYYEPVD